MGAVGTSGRTGRVVVGGAGAADGGVGRVVVGGETVVVVGVVVVVGGVVVDVVLAGVVGGGVVDGAVLKVEGGAGFVVASTVGGAAEGSEVVVHPASSAAASRVRVMGCVRFMGSAYLWALRM